MAEDAVDPTAGYQVGYGNDGKVCARVDITSASQVGDVNLGDEIEVTIRGTVRSLDGPEKRMDTNYIGDGKEKQVKRLIPGTVEIDISSVSFKPSGSFDGMDGEDS